MFPLLRKLIPLRVRLYVRNLTLSGNAFYCPCCKKSAAVFLPFGVRKRPHAECPHCGSLERHRLLWLFLEKETDAFRGKKRILHVAPESVFFQKFANSPSVDYVAIDKFDEGYRYPKGTINMDVTQLAFADRHFDAILCNHVLEHVPDDHKALSELYRVLAPQGWAVIQSPIDPALDVTLEDPNITDPAERIRLFGQPDHVRMYGKDYAKRLKNVGFEVKEINYLASFSEEQINYMGLQQAGDIFFCQKK
jgi:SAM-dependent methyltransferase